jgi:hypothetical protein
VEYKLTTQTDGFPVGLGSEGLPLGAPVYDRGDRGGPGLGFTMGDSDGKLEDRDMLGGCVGMDVGLSDGDKLGGNVVGVPVGVSLGLFDGSGVGARVGSTVGDPGVTVGTGVGLAVGTVVGEGVDGIIIGTQTLKTRSSNPDCFKTPALQTSPLTSLAFPATAAWNSIKWTPPRLGILA